MNNFGGEKETLWPGGLRAIKYLALVLFSISLVFRVRALVIRYFEADELEHLRGAFCVFSGWLPYKDFFEHHTPLIYYLLSPLFYFGETPGVIFISRGLMLLLAGLIFFLVYRLAARCFSPVSAWISLIWLSYIFMFFEKTIETRPDIPALVFLLLGLRALVDYPESRRGIRALSAGACFSLAFLSTQKIVFPVLGVFAVFIFRALTSGSETGRRRTNFRIIALLLSGFAVPLGLTLWYFYTRGGLGDFTYRNFTMNLLWQRREPFHIFLKTLLYENPCFVFWAEAGMIITGRRIFIHPGRDKQDLIWFPALLGIAGLFLIPVILPQTYALIIPLLVIPAGKTLLDFLRWTFSGGITRRLAAGGILFLSGPGIIWLLGIAGSYRPKLTWENPALTLPTYICLGAAVVLFCLAGRNRKARNVFFFLLLLLLIGRPVIFLVNYGRIDNRIQLLEMQEIARTSDSRDRVFDTWPIAGFFRLPAYYYHFLHHGVWKMLSPEEKGPRLLATLEDHRPKIISRGINFSRLPPEVQNYVGRHYRQCGSSRDLLIRIPLEDPRWSPGTGED